VKYAQGGIVSGGGSDPINWAPQAGEKVICSDGRILEWQPIEGGLQLVHVGTWDMARTREALARLNEGEA
jgi:hypothetical protein